MKYNEYEKLALMLEESDKSVNDLVLETTGQGLPINEAEPKELATSSMPKSVAEFKNPFLRKKLTNAAKKLQAMIFDKIINVHYEAMMKDSTEIMNTIVKSEKAGKSTDEIRNALTPNINIIHKGIMTRYNNIEQSMSKLMNNSTTKVNSMLAKKNLNDNVKMNLENYWTLLSTQIFQNAWSEIGKKQADFVNKNIGKELAPLAEEILGSDIPEKKNKEYRLKAEKNKDKDKNAGQEQTGTGTNTVDDKNAQIPTLEKDKKYVYLNSKNQKQNVTVTDITDTGYNVKPDKGNPFSVTKDKANKFTEIKSGGEENATTDKLDKKVVSNKTEPTEEKSTETKEYKPGIKYYFKTKNGKKSILKVLSKNGDKYTVNFGSDPKKAKQEERSQKWMDEYITESVKEPKGFTMVAENLHDFLK
jgi:hypothetical protein